MYFNFQLIHTFSFSKEKHFRKREIITFKKGYRHKSIILQIIRRKAHFFGSAVLALRSFRFQYLSL